MKGIDLHPQLGSQLPGKNDEPGDGRRQALLLVAHDATADPRVEWMAAGLPADFEVCELCVYADELDAAGPSLERVSDRKTRVRVARRRHDWDAVPDIRRMSAAEAPGLHHLTLLHVLAELPSKPLQRAVGGLDADEEDLYRFRWLARYFLNTNSALIQAGRLLGQFDVVIAADLDTLPAALVLAEECGASLVYDAHEFWPYSSIEFRPWETSFWSEFERNLVTRADLRITVSPQLAKIMSAEYGCEFITVANCVSKSSVETINIESALDRLLQRDNVNFIYLGGFAAGRGIEDLITAWQYVRGGARLLLQSPDGPFKTKMVELARRLGLLDKGISFPKPVDAGELIGAARRADVGIIPYAPSSLNNRYCSPNKLSQYMAAGVAIICNTTEYVQSVVCDNDLGIAVDFSDHQRLARAIDELSNAKDRIVAMSRRAHRLFETSFNWEQASAPMYRQLATLMEARSARKYRELDFSWIEQGRQMRELCEQLEGGRAIFTDPTLGLVQLVARRLIGLPFLRSAARGFFASLPDRAGRRIKMRIVALTRL